MYVLERLYGVFESQVRFDETLARLRPSYSTLIFFQFLFLPMSTLYNKQIKLHLRKIYEHEIPLILGLDPLEFDEFEELEVDSGYIYEKIRFKIPRYVQKIT